MVGFQHVRMSGTEPSLEIHSQIHSLIQQFRARPLWANAHEQLQMCVCV